LDSIIRSIIERRHKLGWSTKVLAEKANVPRSAIVRMEQGTGYWEDYISIINSCLKEAINELKIKQELIERNKRKVEPISSKYKGSIDDIDIKTYFPNLERGQIKILFGDRRNIEKNKFTQDTNENDIKDIEPSAKGSGWARHYSKCIKCGSSDMRHIARGLCKSCYDKDIEKRHKDNERIQKYGGSSKLLTAEYLIENYIKQEKSLADIAKETNCSRQYIHKKLKGYEIPLRSKSESRDLALTKDKLQIKRLNEDGSSSFVLLKKTNVNEDFFSSWSSAMAYVLGVIYTDGNLNPGRIRESWRAKSASTIPSITVAQKEPELLEKILHLMDCDAKLYFHKEKVYGNTKAGALYHFRISNEKLYDDIVNLGLTPNKSLIMQFPNVPNEYVRHFIRGCWDGDGSVYIEKESRRIGASFVSGSIEFVDGMVGELVSAGFSNRTIYSKNNESKSYSFKFSGSQVRMLYHYLYDGVPDTEYLERKFKLFRLSLEMNPIKE
jgi:predicted DNA-binding protein YlxM (UPF0122 family)/transcriptional regulator with XRE-family HTH domain